MKHKKATAVSLAAVAGAAVLGGIRYAAGKRKPKAARENDVREEGLTEDKMRECLDIYLNFIGAFEVPEYIVTPAEVEEQRRQREEQAAKEARSKELAKARYEKRKAEKREFTARKKAGLLTPEEQEAEEKRLAHNREWQKEWREKRKASEPEKPPKQKSIKELMEIEKTGADLTPEETERLAAYRRKKADQQRARREGKKSDQPKRKVS